MLSPIFMVSRGWIPLTFPHDVSLFHLLFWLLKHGGIQVLWSSEPTGWEIFGRATVANAPSTYNFCTPDGQVKKRILSFVPNIFDPCHNMATTFPPLQLIG